MEQYIVGWFSPAALPGDLRLSFTPKTGALHGVMLSAANEDNCLTHDPAG